MPFLNDTKIADDKQYEQVLKGIQPKNQRCYKFFLSCRFIAGLFLFFAVGAALMKLNSAFDGYTKSDLYVATVLLLVLGALVCAVLAFLTKALFLRKAPFDDWVFEIAEKRLGTSVIFYDSKRIYIQYDRGGKEVDKKDFVAEMSDKSIHYSYFYVKTHIDEGVIVVECKKREPIPKVAVFEKKDDTFWNIIPLGLTIHPTLQKITPIGWYLNKESMNDELYETIPSVSLLIAGGTGCFSKNTAILMHNTLRR